MRYIEFVVAMAISVVCCGAQAAPDTGDQAPDAIGYNYDGQRLSLASYAGKVVVVSFWASWCGPCRKELPLLEGIARAAGKDRVQVLAVNIESRDIYRKLARKMSELEILVASDPDESAQRAYGVNGIPHMVIVGRDGRIVRVHRGYTDSGVDAAIADLNHALAR